VRRRIVLLQARTRRLLLRQAQTRRTERLREIQLRTAPLREPLVKTVRPREQRRLDPLHQGPRGNSPRIRMATRHLRLRRREAARHRSKHGVRSFDAMSWRVLAARLRINAGADPEVRQPIGEG
jgi:hypothetical protein